MSERTGPMPTPDSPASGASASDQDDTVPVGLLTLNQTIQALAGLIDKPLTPTDDAPEIARIAKSADHHLKRMRLAERLANPPEVWGDGSYGLPDA